MPEKNADMLGMVDSPARTRQHKPAAQKPVPAKTGLAGKLRARLRGLFGRGAPGKSSPASASASASTPPKPQAAPASAPVKGAPRLWQTTRPELLETIWGKGWHLPLGVAMTDVLVRATGLTKEMSVLDLSAGLGGMARKIAEEYKTYVTGLEPDAALAGYATHESKRLKMTRTVSIAAYDPETYVPEKRYDCVLARELFFRIQDRPRFIKAVAASLKNYGQVSWTDFLAESDVCDHPAVAAWRAHELGGRAPMALQEVTDLWQTLNYDLRVAEDRTDKYMQGILSGLGGFVRFFQGRKIAETAKPVVLAEIELWARRAAALQRGVRLYRFYALKK